MLKNVAKILLIGIFFAGFLSFFSPGKINAATLTNASATLSNSRLSYRANTATGTAGTSTVTITGSGYPDNNTNHLFPGDNICFTNAGPTGCIGSVSYTVATVAGATTFNTATTLTTNVDAAGYVVATQSGNMTLTFTLVSTIPAGGNIYIKIPVASTGNVNDGIPDTGTTNVTNGFDFNKLQSTNVNVSTTGGTCADGWNNPTVASASGTITITKATSSCAGATVTIVVPGLVNPSPFVTNHTQGIADAYKIQILTRDGSNNPLDSTNVVVAPIEGVLVSANIDQTLSFTVGGINSGVSACGATTSVATYPYAVPWGTIATTNSFLNAAQLLTVSTNASSGYVVTVEENDQMGLNGGSCSGAGAGESLNCIKDTTCNAACNQVNTAEWTTATNNGLGYTLATVSGTPAVFYYGESGRTFSARQFADQEASETKQNIMSWNLPVSSDQAYVCYRISVSGTQPAGYYYNKVKYTATARF